MLEETSARACPSRYKKLIAATALGGMIFAGAAVAQTTSEGPTQKDFLNAGNDTANWILPARTYKGNRYIEESQITAANVDQLKPAWTFKIPDDSPIEAAPIIWHGTVYLTSAHNVVYAVDGKTGQLKWSYDAKPNQIVGFSRNRGVALLNGKVFVATIGGHLISLDAKTGKEIWDKLEVQDPKTSFYSMSPVPYKGMLLLGVSDGDWGGIGNISAFDPETGKRIWQWKTIPGPGEPGHKSWSGDSWKRGGGAVWSGFGIDAKTDTLYAGVGNPQPDFLGKFRKGKNLYTNSIVALDISGKKPKLKWYYQFIPHGTHDWDPSMPPVLFTGKVDGEDRELVATGDKAGNFWILDAKSGKLISRTPVSFQYNQDKEPARKKSVACPNTNGGIEYNGGSYDPATNTFFVPSSNQCGIWQAHSKAVYIAGQFYLGGSFPKLLGPNTGWFNAVDVSTGVFSWRHHLNLPANGGALIMANSGSDSVVLTGQIDGQFDAFNAKSGKMLWQFDTGSSIVAPPATYMTDNTRYVIVASGQPGFLKVPELKSGNAGAMLTAFTVTQKAQ